MWNGSENPLTSKFQDQEKRAYNLLFIYSLESNLHFMEGDLGLGSVEGSLHPNLGCEPDKNKTARNVSRSSNQEEVNHLSA